MNALKKIGYSYLIIFSLAFCSSQPKGIIILCAGDSITEADYPRFLQRILDKEGIKAKVLNYGQSGNTSGEYLRFLKKDKIILAEEHPDFVLLQLGTNDVRLDQDSTPSNQFYLNMKEIIKILRKFENRSEEATQILIALIPPIPGESPFPFSEESSARVRDEINPLIQKICSEEKIPLVDNYSFFLQSPHLLPEVHPTKEGYRKLAQNWFDALKSRLQ